MGKERWTMTNTSGSSVIPENPYRVRARLRQNAAIFESAQPLSKGQVGSMIGVLEKACGGRGNRYAVTTWIFLGTTMPEGTSKNLSIGQISALYDWVEPHKDDDGEWKGGSSFSKEIITVLREALVKYYREHIQHGVPEDEWIIDAPWIATLLSEDGARIKSISESDDDTD